MCNWMLDVLRRQNCGSGSLQNKNNHFTMNKVAVADNRDHNRVHPEKSARFAIPTKVSH